MKPTATLQKLVQCTKPNNNRKYSYHGFSLHFIVPFSHKLFCEQIHIMLRIKLMAFFRSKDAQKYPAAYRTAIYNTLLHIKMLADAIASIVIQFHFKNIFQLSEASLNLFLLKKSRCLFLLIKCNFRSFSRKFYMIC